MKVFLTGGTGFIGQPLTRQLIQRGWKITALVRNPQSASAQAIQAMGAAVVKGDLSTLDAIRTAMSGADIVIHNAGAYEIGITSRAKHNMYEVNVTGTDNILRIALDLKIPRVVYVSSVWAYGETGTEPVDETFKRDKPFYTYYEQTKSEAHDIALKYQAQGLPLIIAAPMGVIGTNDHSVFGYFIRMYINHLLPPMAWRPNAILPAIHVDDVAEGIALMAEKSPVGETYCLTGEPITTRAMFALWGGKPGGLKFRIYLPTMVAYVLFGSMEPLLRLLGMPAFLSRETVRLNTNLNYSSEKAKTRLGWTHRSAKEAWESIIDEEIELRNKRQSRNLVTLLKPI